MTPDPGIRRWSGTSGTRTFWRLMETEIEGVNRSGESEQLEFSKVD
jgi:hypothetical protein